ncbi:MAG TPA: MoaD/ThiS family protein [Candidatus Omnitrophota bacterium]|nr:MoaD/ThiS family protein [Candidatus Omnitrophota bacterium]
MVKTVSLYYYSIFREQSGAREESFETNVSTVSELFEELKAKYKFSLSNHQVKVAVNDEFCDWQTPVCTKDKIVFIPPVAGG